MSLVCAALPACTVLVTLVCLGQSWPAFTPMYPLHKTASPTLLGLPTPQSFKALMCVCSLITKNQGKHTLQSGSTSIYTAVYKLFQCHNKDKNKKILCMKCLVVQDTDTYIYIYFVRNQCYCNSINVYTSPPQHSC